MADDGRSHAEDRGQGRWGVSPSTVSNAYNKPDQLSAALRERILATAQELGYAGPDASARALRSGKAGAIGVLFTDKLAYAFSDPYAVGFLAGLAEVAEEFRTSLLLMPLSSTDIVERQQRGPAGRDRRGRDLLCGARHPALGHPGRPRHPDGLHRPAVITADLSWVAIDEVEAAARSWVSTWPGSATATSSYWSTTRKRPADGCSS